MRQLLICRRTFIALVSIAALVAVGLVNHMDVSYAISVVAVGLAASNATQESLRHKFEALATQPKE